jgi:hypothetical protein
MGRWNHLFERPTSKGCESSLLRSSQWLLSLFVSCFYCFSSVQSSQYEKLAVAMVGVVLAMTLVMVVVMVVAVVVGVVVVGVRGWDVSVLVGLDSVLVGLDEDGMVGCFLVGWVLAEEDKMTMQKFRMNRKKAKMPSMMPLRF